MGSGSRLELESEFAQWEQFLYSPVLRSGLESESETISESVSGNVNKPVRLLQQPVTSILAYSHSQIRIPIPIDVTKVGSKDRNLKPTLCSEKSSA